MRRMIQFFKDWHDDMEHIGGNFDGILAAIAELSKRHGLIYITRSMEGSHEGDFYQHGIKHVTLDNASTLTVAPPDVAIFWGSLDRPWHSTFAADLRCPKILCFAGGPLQHDNLKYFDMVLVESEVYEQEFKKMGIPVRRAFGTNTDVFRPEPRTTKVFEAIYPASFCSHKNIDLFARVMGPRGLAVGNWNETDIVGACLRHGTPVMRRVSSAVLTDLYNMSRVTMVPCGTWGGAQRVVLESMSCGVPVVIANDNEKCTEFVRESGFGLIVPPVAECLREAVRELIEHPLDANQGRNYILSKWTEWHYAAAIEAAIEEVLK